MISIIVLTKNEEKNILDCLESISWADEIIVVDDFSNDRTTEVVKNFASKEKIKIYQNHLEQDFAAQRNYSLSKATKEWVLFVDADERISSKLREEINAILIEEKVHKNYAGFLVQRDDSMWEKLLKHGETGKIKLLRLARKNAGVWQGKVHEEWQVEGRIGELDNHLLHFPHPKIDEFLSEINFYTTIRAKELHEKGIKTSVWEIIFYPLGKFIVNYFLKLGLLDGLEGLVFAILMSLHSFLVRAKLWTYLERN